MLTIRNYNLQRSSTTKSCELNNVLLANGLNISENNTEAIVILNELKSLLIKMDNFKYQESELEQSRFEMRIEQSDQQCKSGICCDVVQKHCGGKDF